MRSNTLRVILCVVLIGTMATALHYTLSGAASPVGGEISRFTSYQELTYFVKTNTKDTRPWMPFVAFRGGAEIDTPIPSPVADTMLAPEAGSGADYSATNIQVSSVDEADTVKTDGEYLYIVSGNRTIIVKAYPPEEARVLCEIEFEGMPIGIFINGDRLVVFEAEVPDYDSPVATERRMSYIYYPSAGTSIKVYDVSDREDPVLQRELSVDGRYISSRMIGDYAYVVVNDRVYDEEGEVRLPVIYSGDEEHEIPAADIYYCDVPDYSYMYTTIIAINTQDDEEEPTVETILLGASSNLYVSPNNIYLTIPLWGRSVGGFHKTSIHRIQIEDGDIDYVASGEVPGRVLNQFSMDEHDDHLRIATTTRGQAITRGWRVLADEFSAALGGTDTPAPQPSLNHVYVLNMDLDVVGSVEGLAPTERIFSARFMGDRAYLVTFEIIDPLFVIDLEDPEDPRVLGELKITGYSDYLHLYDENHLIGIGKETIEAESGDFSWFQGVKISLFDVSDVEEPEEIYKYEIGHRGTESPVLRDHKAFLFDRSRNLMVLPVLVAEIDESDFPDGVPDWAYGKPVWQGAYVFDISPDDGITLRGGITHVDSPDKLEQRRYSFSSPYSVTRSLYIGDVLYTISEALIKMNDLDDLDTTINQVELPYPTREEPNLLPDEPSSDEPWGDEPSVGEDTEEREVPGD